MKDSTHMLLHGIEIGLQAIMVMGFVLYSFWIGPMLMRGLEAYSQWQARLDGASQMADILAAMHPQGWKLEPVLPAYDPDTLPTSTPTPQPPTPTETSRKEGSK